MWKEELMSMRRLNNQEREDFVLDLYYNQNKTYRQIAREAKICPRDIGRIVNKESKEIESKQSLSKVARAYKLFSEGKSPREVAIALDLREPDVTQLYKESWNLEQLYDLNKMYMETKGDIAYIVTLYRLAKAEGMNPQQVTKLLTIANGDLPGLEKRCENLTIEINSLEEQKQNSQRILRDLNNQITEFTSYIGHCRASYKQEEMQFEALRQKRMKLEALVRQFENNNPEYVKIRKTAEEKVRSALLNGRDILKLALFSLTETMRKDPDRYVSLIYYDTPPTIDYSNNQYPYSSGFYMYGQREYRSREDFMAMLVEETDKLFNELVKELVDEIISDYPVSTSSPSLRHLPSSDQEGRTPKTY